MSNVSIQEIPSTLVDAILRQENVCRVFYLSKGSSELLYVITHKEDEKEVFNVVSYGKLKITEYLKGVYSKPKEELSFAETSALQKLFLFIQTLFSEYDLESIEIDGNRLSLGQDIDEFLKSIST